VQVQPHLRIAGAELADDRGQHVARLGVRGADREAPAALVAQLRGEVADALRLLQDAQRPLSMTCCPAGVMRVSVRPSRTKIWKPSSSSRSLICLLTPGCEVCSFCAAAVMLSPLWATAARYRNWCSFMARVSLTQAPASVCARCNRPITGA
jgi:hypothetical protein